MDASSVISVSNIFLTKGINLLIKSKEFKNLTISVRDRVLRECKYNLTMIDYLLEKDAQSQETASSHRKQLIESLSIATFDQISEGVIPIRLFFSEAINKDQLKITNKQLTNRIKNCEFLYQLIEQMYFRIKIHKAILDKVEKELDVKHLKKLLLLTISELKRES